MNWVFLEKTNQLNNGGGKEIRTLDIQLAKLALYQLSYAPMEEPGFISMS